MFRQIVEQHPSKYPTRMGEKWEDDEVIKLLSFIQKKYTIEDIAIQHERTVGAIRSQLRNLAAEYWFNDKRPIEEICKFTGLTKAQIEDTIKRREHITEINRIKNTKKISDESVVQPDMKEVIARLNDIQSMLAVLIEKVQ